MAGRRDPSRYSGATDDEFQPGSRKAVLVNKLGIISRRKMDDLEILAYKAATENLAKSLARNHRFSAQDVKTIHKKIFGNIYEWAGSYRNKDLSKRGFMFTRAIFIAEHMEQFSKNILEAYTPPKVQQRDELTAHLAEIHNELVLIHPFREGNGRTVRLLVHLVAQQAGFGGLDFSFIKGRGKEYERYIAAVQAGVSRNYEPMEAIIQRALF